MFSRSTIRLGIGPHSSLLLNYQYELFIYLYHVCCRFKNICLTHITLQLLNSLTLLAGWQEGPSACKNMGDGGGGHWLVQMEWHPAGWSLCLPLLIFPCTIKSRSSLLAPAHLGGPGKRAIKQLCGGGGYSISDCYWKLLCVVKFCS